MTDNERRVRAAELMGATDFSICEGDDQFEGYWPEEDEGRGEGWKPVPDYPHDMNAAMELVRGARADELTFELYQGAHHGGQWDAAFFGGDGVAVGCGRDELPARAITDAFIEAMRDQISE